MPRPLKIPRSTSKAQQIPLIPEDHPAEAPGGPVVTKPAEAPDPRIALLMGKYEWMDHLMAETILHLSDRKKVTSALQGRRAAREVKEAAYSVEDAITVKSENIVDN